MKDKSEIDNLREDFFADNNDSDLLITSNDSIESHNNRQTSKTALASEASTVAIKRVIIKPPRKSSQSTFTVDKDITQSNKPIGVDEKLSFTKPLEKNNGQESNEDVTIDKIKHIDNTTDWEKELSNDLNDSSAISSLVNQQSRQKKLLDDPTHNNDEQQHTKKITENVDTFANKDNTILKNDLIEVAKEKSSPTSSLKTPAGKRANFLWRVSTRSIFFLYKHKIKTCVIILILLLLSMFFSVGFSQLLKHNHEDKHIIYFDKQIVGDKLVVDNSTSEVTKRASDNTPPMIIQKIQSEYQKGISGHSNIAFFVFCSKQSDYLSYFYDIAQTEWKYFQWFNLGAWWINHWHNMGPIEALAKSYFDDKSNYKNIYAYNYDANDKSTASKTSLLNINIIASALGQNIKKRNKVNINLSGWQFNSSEITRKVLLNGSLSSDDQTVQSKWFTDIVSGPIIIKLIGTDAGDVEVHICNNLLNFGQLMSL